MSRWLEKVRRAVEREWFLLLILAMILIVTMLFDLI